MVSNGLQILGYDKYADIFHRSVKTSYILLVSHMSNQLHGVDARVAIIVYTKRGKRSYLVDDTKVIGFEVCGNVINHLVNSSFYCTHSKLHSEIRC